MIVEVNQESESVIHSSLHRGLSVFCGEGLSIMGIAVAL
jgi:hypothetical protein